MALPSLYSRRKRQATGTGADVYSYEDIPPNVRVQIVHIVKEAVGDYYSGYQNRPPREAYNFIAETLRKEFGVFQLGKYRGEDASEELFQWFLSEPDIDKLLDFIELTFRVIDGHIRDRPNLFRDYIKTNPDSAIAELNARLQEAAIGFSFEDGDVIRVDSRVVHSQIVVPALHLLANPAYAAVDAEYRAAHEAYRHADYETTIVQCAKAFESTLKVIGAKRGWAITPNDPAKRLLDAAYQAGFIEPSLQAEFTALRSLLESAVPTVRNRSGGHGAGATPRQIPPELSALQLHQTAAAILFLANHDEALP